MRAKVGINRIPRARMMFCLPLWKMAMSTRKMATLLTVEWLQRDKEHGLQGVDTVVKWRWLRYMLYAAAFVAVIYYRGDYAEFIYFQF